MKVFWITVAVFLVLLGFIIYNYIYVNNTSDELISAAESLPSVEDTDCLYAAQELRDRWEEVCAFIELSSYVSKIDNITDLADSLCVYAETQSAVEFERIRLLLINAFEEITAFESFSPGDIF